MDLRYQGLASAGVAIRVKLVDLIVMTVRTYSLSDILTHLSLASFLWDIGKQHSPRCDAAERGVPSGAILFA